MMLYVSLFSVPFPFLFQFFVPESYRFLIGKERFFEARKVMTKFMSTRKAAGKMLHPGHFQEKFQGTWSKILTPFFYIFEIGAIEKSSKKL